MNWKKQVKKIANRILTYNEQELEKKLESCGCVSFDIFDTLIKRSVARPRDAFYYAAQRYNRYSSDTVDPAQFCDCRVAAEEEARKCAMAQNREEVTLEEIYRYLPEAYQEVAQKLLDAELEMEKSCCHADPTMKKVYRWCQKSGKRIFITSDMYLPRQTVEEILQQNGYSGYTLLLSSDCGVTKRSGNLFTVLLQQDGVEQDALIHVGDNLRGDILGAKKQGIRALWIANDPDRCRFTRLHKMDARTRKQMQPIRTIMNGYIDPDWDPYYQFGFEVLGPLLYGFCTWLHESVKKDGLDKIFFLSRDGYLMQQGYRLLYGEEAIENSYLYASRKALFIPQLWIKPNFEEIIWTIGENTVWNCTKLCDKLGADPEEGKRIWTECGLSLKQNYLSQDLGKDPKAFQFYQRIQSEIIQHSKDAYAVFLQYLQQEQFYGRVAVVDIGWRGSMQYYLQNILEHSPINAESYGYYVGRIQEVVPDIHLSAYIPPEAQPRTGGAGLFESLFLAQEGSTRTYQKDEQGNILPVLYESEYTETGETENIRAYQSGALEFIRVMKTGIGAQTLEHTVSAANLYQSIRKPRKLELRLFADFSFSDGVTYPLAAPQSLWTYFKNPRRLIYDFANSQWKIGFMKRLFKLPLPYWKVLHLLKQIRNV